MVKHLGVLIAFTEDQGLIPSTHMTQNCLYLQLQGIWHTLLASLGTACFQCTYILRQGTYTTKIKIKKSSKNIPLKYILWLCIKHHFGDTWDAKYLQLTVVLVAISPDVQLLGDFYTSLILKFSEFSLSQLKLITKIL